MTSDFPTCDTHVFSTLPGTLNFFKMIIHRAVRLLTLCINYLRNPLWSAPYDRTAYTSSFMRFKRNLTTWCSGSSQAFLLGVAERWQSGGKGRLREKAAKNHFNRELARPTRLTPQWQIRKVWWERMLGRNGSTSPVGAFS